MFTMLSIYSFVYWIIWSDFGPADAHSTYTRSEFCVYFMLNLMLHCEQL